MAEFAVGVAGLAFAMPGVIEILSKYGNWIWERIQTFKNAKDVWVKMDQFGWSLSQGELNGLIVAAKSFYLKHGCDPGLKNSLDVQISRLFDNVKSTKTFLENHDPSSFRKRVVFTISGEKRAKELNKALTSDKMELAQILMINDIRTRRVPEQLLLTSKRFQRYETAPYQPVTSTLNLFVTRGDYRDDPLEGPYHETTVIIERGPISEQVPEETLKEIATFLHYDFHEKIFLKSADLLPKGILPCLGYRMEPSPELIFAMPKGTHNPQMLQSIIAADQGVARHPLDFRFRLAQRLSEAVLMVHAANLVHKNIRIDTILVLRPIVAATHDDLENVSGFDNVYLTNWRLLRDVSGPTIMGGGNQWTEDLYRHPKRQGTHVEERYNIGHDIYSLGVCLLEIGLWDLLVHRMPADGQPQVSELFRAAAEVNSHPDPEAELRAKLSRPTTVKDILLKLASENLPQRMGHRYHRLVAACLTGLDQLSGFGPEVDFTKLNQVEQGIAFKDLILSIFTEMTIL